MEWSSGVVEWSSRIVERSSERAKLLLGKDLYAQILVEFMKHFASTFQYLSSHKSTKDLLCTDFGRICETFCINFSISELPNTKDLLCTDFGRICETFCIKKTLCLFSNDSFRYAHLRFAQMSLLGSRFARTSQLHSKKIWVKNL